MQTALLGLGLGCHAPNPDFGQWELHAGTGGTRVSGPAAGTGGTSGAPSNSIGNTPGASLPPIGQIDPPDAEVLAPRVDGGAASDAGAASDTGPVSDTEIAAPVSYTGDLKKGLTLYLPLDDMAGGIAADASGKKSSASLKSLDAQAWTLGRFGTALALSGATSGAAWNGWVDVSGTALTSAVSQAFTVGMWIWRTDAGGTLLSRGTKGALLTFGLDGANLIVQMNTAAAYKVSLRAGAAVPAGRWVHVAVTFDMKEVRLYVDGLAAGAVAYQQGISLDTTSYIVGGVAQSDRSVGARFTGKIDEVVLYTRALTASEVDGLARGARPQSP